MNRNTTNLVLSLAGVLALSLIASDSVAQTNAFTYQGHLTANGSPAVGSYDLIFQLFDAPTGGNQVSVAITNADQLVSNGLFSATLDFGSGAFTGPDRWLQIGVRTNGSPEAFVPLAPRQLLTPAPYALYALSANTAQTASNVSAASISGQLTLGQLPGQVVTNGASGLSLSGSFSGNGAGLADLNLAVRSYNRTNTAQATEAGEVVTLNDYSTVINTNTEAHTLSLNLNLYNLQYNTMTPLQLWAGYYGSADWPFTSLYGARVWSGNYGPGYVGHVIGVKIQPPSNSGGGTVGNLWGLYVIQPQDPANPNFYGNSAIFIEGTNGAILWSGMAGVGNYGSARLSSPTPQAVLWNLNSWTLTDNTSYESIWMGPQALWATTNGTPIYDLNISTLAQHGGAVIDTYEYDSTLTLQAGGLAPTATSLVLGDGYSGRGGATLTQGGATLLAASTNGVRIPVPVTGELTLGSGGGYANSSIDGGYGYERHFPATNGVYYYLPTNGDFVLHGSTLNGDIATFTEAGGGLKIAGSFICDAGGAIHSDDAGNLTVKSLKQTSDREAKEHFRALDSDAPKVLRQLAALPVSEWNFRGETERHYGPTAQDFRSRFGLGDGRHISVVDQEAVTILAVKGLYAKTQSQTRVVWCLVAINALLLLVTAHHHRKIQALKNQLPLEERRRDQP